MGYTVWITSSGLVGWLVMYVVGWKVWFSTWALSWVRVGVRNGLHVHQGFGVWTSKFS